MLHCKRRLMWNISKNMTYTPYFFRRNRDLGTILRLCRLCMGPLFTPYSSAQEECSTTPPPPHPLEKLGQSRKNSENTDENTVSTHARTHTHTHIHTHALYAQCYASFAYAVGSRQSGTRRPRRGKTSSTGVITREHVRSSRGLGSQTARPVGGWAETSTARLAHRMSVPTGTRPRPTHVTEPSSP